MVQVTAVYESPSVIRYKNHGTLTEMHAVHITVLPTGPSNVEPLCITLPKPATQGSYDICKEILKLLDNNKFVLRATYANHEHYWANRAKQNSEMKVEQNSKFMCINNSLVLRC